MSDLIKRSDAIEAIEVVDWYHQNRNKDMVSGANSNEHQAWYKADDVYKALEAVPPADRSQGEWIVSYIDGIKQTECSACGESFTTYDVYGWRYCPWCGAKMKGTDDEVR